MDTTCGIYLINNNGCVLICHPTNHPWDLWSIPKGLLDGTETEIEAATRELLEETNIDLNSIDHSEPIQLPDVIYKRGDKKLSSFIIKIKDNISEDKLHCNSWVGDKFPEVDIIKWASIESARELLHDSQVANLDKIVIDV